MIPLEFTILVISPDSVSSIINLLNIVYTGVMLLIFSYNI